MALIEFMADVIRVLVIAMLVVPGKLREVIRGMPGFLAIVVRGFLIAS